MEFLLQLMAELFNGDFMHDEASENVESSRNDIFKSDMVSEEEAQYEEIPNEEELLFNFMHFR